ncbi:hypothetical protein HYT57_01100 [Candidatus Woesearchaeota archaeon]|nr:hypothetical protein [Candidatus Woesearchaeota archaeon]
MLYLTLITFGVFVLFWLGDLYLTLKTVKHLGRHIEINPIIKFVLKGRRKLIYLFKPIELIAFLYLIWFLNKFEGVIPFYILLMFILFYALLVVNNAHVFYKVTRKESGAFKVVFIGLTIAMLFFIYLNYLLYLDLGISYNALSRSNDRYNELFWQCKERNNSINAPEPQDLKTAFPELDLPIRRSGLE